MGTLHLAVARGTPSWPEATQRLDLAGRLVLEVGLAELDGLVGDSSQGPQLAEVLDRSELERFGAVVAALGLPPAALEGASALQCALLMITLLWPVPGIGVDRMLAEHATAQGWSVLGLETPAEHVASVREAPTEDVAALLRAQLQAAEGSPWDRWRSADALSRAYRAGDLGAVVREWEALLPGLAEPWLHGRNGRMAERAHLLALEAPTFVAVGAAHLIGEGGLIQRLRDLGWTVAPVTVAPEPPPQWFFASPQPVYELRGGAPDA